MARVFSHLLQKKRGFLTRILNTDFNSWKTVPLWKSRSPVERFQDLPGGEKTFFKNQRLDPIKRVRGPAGFCHAIPSPREHKPATSCPIQKTERSCVPEGSGGVDSTIATGSWRILLPIMWEARVRSLGWEDPLEKEMATHSSILAWRIPWTEEPGRPQSMGLQRVGHD